MNIDFFKSNIKFKNLKSFKLNFFPGTLVKNYSINLLFLNGVENKKIINYPIILDCIDKNNYILNCYKNKNNFLMYNGGYNFLDNSIYNEKIIFLSPFIKGNSINIFTTLVSIKLINNILNNNIYDNNYNKELEKKIFGYEIKNEKIKIENLFYTDYIKNIIEYEENFNKDNVLYPIYLKLVQTDIKINFLINLIFKFNVNFTSDDLIKFYNFIWDKFESIDKINSLDINNFFKSNIIDNTELFDKIIYNWFIYINLCEKSIRLINIVNTINKKSLLELSENNINKNNIVDSLINSLNKNMFKIGKTLLD